MLRTVVGTEDNLECKAPRYEKSKPNNGYTFKAQM